MLAGKVLVDRSVNVLFGDRIASDCRGIQQPSSQHLPQILPRERLLGDGTVALQPPRNFQHAEGLRQ
jgi:hypothetical protein